MKDYIGKSGSKKKVNRRQFSYNHLSKTLRFNKLVDHHPSAKKLKPLDKKQLSPYQTVVSHHFFDVQGTPEKKNSRYSGLIEK